MKKDEKKTLTSDYRSLVTRYMGDQKKMISGSSKYIPVILEDWLFAKPIVIEDHAAEHYDAPGYIVRHYEELFAAHKMSAVYNNINIRVNDWGIQDGKYVITTGRTSYFDSLVTNRAMDYKLESCKGEPSTVREAFEQGLYITPLSKSKLSNHLGFNGFVISSDNYIPIVHRSGKVSIGKYTWSDSIGASLKTKYAVNADGKFTLDGLKNGVVKEIEDELGISDDKLITVDSQFEKFELLASYRDLVEGGKPQLLFLSRSRLSRKEIEYLFFDVNKKAKKEAKNAKGRDKIEKELITDGNEISWIKVSELPKVEVYSDRIVYGNKEFSMMPSASACIAMLKTYFAFEL